MPTIYGNNPRILDRAQRSSQSVSQIGKAASPRAGTQPKGFLDTQIQDDCEAVTRMSYKVDPLTGRPQQTGPAHLRARLKSRPDMPQPADGNTGASSQ